MVGAQGLGERVLYAINRIDISLGFEAGIMYRTFSDNY